MSMGNKISIESMKYYYQENLWKLEQLNKLLELNKITKQEYDEIISSKK